MKIKRIIGVIICVLIYFILGLKVEHNINLVNSLNKLEKSPIYKMDTVNKEIYLTFDVNWAEDDRLYEILDVLDKHEIKATFFVMGKWVIYPEGNKEKLVEIHKRGHTIGNHSYVHPDFTKISKERMEKEILDTEKIIEECIGVKTDLFRFPSGAFSKDGVGLVYSLGYIPYQWDVDSKDWMNEGSRKEYDNVKNKVKDGSIVLYHNNGKYTPENIDKLITELKKEGYFFKTLLKNLTN